MKGGRDRERKKGREEGVGEETILDSFIDPMR